LSRVKFVFLTFIAAIGVFALVLLAPLLNEVAKLPSSIFLSGDASQTLKFHIPLNSKVSTDAVGVLRVNGEMLGTHDAIYPLGDDIVLSAETDGTAEVHFNVLGITIKTIKVTVGQDKRLIPGGQSIGVMLYTNGALVVGASDIVTNSGQSVNPAKDAGLRSGDVIEKVNGQGVENASQLSELINQDSSDTIELTVRRENEEQKIKITPVLDSTDQVYKLGVWVRDSTAGVGTMTFYDPQTKRYAGLGHAITDADTGKQLSIREGEIIESKIIEVVKGVQGTPGELRGYFNPMSELLGTIRKNTSFGIYGETKKEMSGALYPQGLPVGARDLVELGEASILCTLDDSGVREYRVKIIKLNRQESAQQKSFIVEVTDPALLAKTGGIVQGMSGSPVIQNGKLIGAVTHVFVNDPTRGYGLYIDWMLNEIQW